MTTELPQGFYPENPDFELSDSGRHFKLLEDLLYVDAYGGHHEVEAGFETDFASVPKIFWSFVGPIGLQSLPAVIHDEKYRFGKGTRLDADILFRDALKFQGMGYIKRNLMFYAVRIGGRGNF